LSEAAREVRFIGRQEELDSLSKALEDATSGRGSTVILSGEPGIGKTRLVGELEVSALDAGFRVLSGAASADTLQPFLMFTRALEEVLDAPLFSEREQVGFAKVFAVDETGKLLAQSAAGDLDADIFTGTLSAVQDFVRDSFDSSGSEGLGKLEYGDMTILVEHGSGILLTAVFRGTEHADMRPSLGRSLREMEAGDPGKVREAVETLAATTFLVRRELEGVNLQTERLRIADTVLETLGTDGDAPLLLLLEDLHWADESSLFVLNYLARNAPASRMLIACTMRPGESQVLERTLEAMRAESLFTEMALGRLGEDDVSGLIGDLYPDHRFPDSAVQNIAAQCEGNPFFVIETLLQMAETGHIVEDGDTFKLTEDDPVIPATVEEAVHRRLETLGPETLGLVEYASCIGRRFDRSALLSLETISDPATALDDLIATGMVTLADGSGEFSHAIFQEVVYSSLGDRWRIAHHKSLGEYYEGEYADRPDEVMYELARHFARTGEKAKAHGYCVLAGEKAEAAYAPEQALVFYGEALEALPGARLPDAGAKELELVERLGDLHNLNGQFDEALERYGEAIGMTDGGRHKARLYAKRSLTYQGKGEKEGCISEALKGLDLLGDEICIERAQLIGSQSWGYLIGGEFDKAIQLLEENFRIVEVLGDKDAMALAHHRIGTVYGRRGESEKGLEHLRESLRYREEKGNDNGAALVRVNIGSIYDDLGEYERSLEVYLDSLETFKRNKDKYHIGLITNNIGVANEGLGNLEEAFDRFTEAMELSRQLGDMVGVINSTHNSGFVNTLMGKPEVARGFFERGLELCERLGLKHQLIYFHRGLANCAVMSGDPDGAAGHAEKAFELTAGLGLPAEEAENTLLNGIILRERDQLSESREALEKAMAAYEQLGVEDKVASARYELALLRGREGEPTMARELLEQALETYRARKMKHMVRRTEAALAELDALPG